MHLYTIDCVLQYKINTTTNMLLQVQTAQHPEQQILNEQLEFHPSVKWHEFSDATHQNRYVRFNVEPSDAFEIRYTATVQKQASIDPSQFKELEIADLPDEVLPYLFASRYCDSEKLVRMATRTFDDIPKGYARIKAIEQWIYTQILYESGSSDENTVASDVLIQRAGVCRDFAHLGIAICRALGIPARMVVGYVDIENFSPDFHAIFEVYLEGGWVLFDATRLANPQDLIRIATGIDASDVAFATYYGDIELISMQPLIIPSNESAA